MYHGVKKIKFRQGQDSDQMLIRKLTSNFFWHGKLKTSLKKARVVKSLIEKLVEKIKNSSMADRNYLKRKLADNELIDLLIKEAAPVFKDKVGGYVRLIKLGTRMSDGSEMARVEWVYPVVLNSKKKDLIVEDKKPVSKEK
jgi:large subunit ribosomal protein L17